MYNLSLKALSGGMIDFLALI